VPLHADTRAAIEEMERSVSQLGAVGVMVNTYDRSRNIAHRDFWPFYGKECAREGRGRRLSRLGQRHDGPAVPFREFPANPYAVARAGAADRLHCGHLQWAVGKV